MGNQIDKNAQGEKGMSYQYKLLGLVTLYNPDTRKAIDNIKRYAYELDALIIWDNSPLEEDYRHQILTELSDITDRIIWHGTGENLCIAPAINYGWHYAIQERYDMLLIMDQDSQWDSFSNYRQQVEHYWSNGNKWVFTPYIKGYDNWMVADPICNRRIFINSGTIIPIEILNIIHGADEEFPLDALDHDLSYRILKANYQVVCITKCILNHTIGKPRRSKFLHIVTNDYGRERTYSKTKCHIMNYRRHKDVMTLKEQYVFFKRIFISKFFRIILVEEDKVGRLGMFFKGIKDGLTYQFNKSSSVKPHSNE